MSFLECEIAVTPARASLSIETTTLFLVRGQHSCLELRDCALSGIRAPQDKVTAVEVEPQPAEVGECTSVVCVRSCSLSHFAHAIVAQDNTIVKVERSHFQRTRGSALSLADPVWCYVSLTVFDHCSGAASIDCRLGSQDFPVERRIVLEGNLVSNCLGSAVRLLGAGTQPSADFSSKQLLTLKDFPVRPSLFEEQDEHLPICADLASRVHLSLSRNKFILNGKDGLCVRGVVL